MKLPIRASILSAAAIFCLPGILAAQNTAETAAETAAAEPAEEMTIDWIQEIINGGMTSAVLLLLSAAAIGFLVERLGSNHASRHAPQIPLMIITKHE